MTTVDSTARLPLLNPKPGEGPYDYRKPPKKNAVEVPTLELPGATEAEEAYLACIIHKPGVLLLEDVASVRADDFTEHGRRALFSAVWELINAGKPPNDPAVLCAKLKATPFGGKTLFDSLGEDYLYKLQKSAPIHIPYAPFHAEEIKKAAQNRRRILALNGAMWRIGRGEDPGEACRGVLESLQEVEASTAPPATMFPLVDAEELFTTDYTLQWLIPGKVVRGQPGLIVGPKKVLKTSLAEDLAVSLSVGAKFLGCWEVAEPLNVLFMSAESGAYTLAETAKRVCDSKGIDQRELYGRLKHCWNVPLLDNLQHMDEMKRTLDTAGIDVCIFDPAYMMFGGDTDAANLISMGARLRNLNDLCAERNVTPLLIHHFRKGRVESGTPQLEDIAYAGFQEFARQWFMIDREEEYKPGSGEHKLVFSWGGSAGQSGEVSLVVSEGINDGFGGERYWAVEVLTRKQKSDRKADAKQKELAAEVQACREAIDKAFRAKPGVPLTTNDLEHLTGKSPRGKAFKEAWSAMYREGRLEEGIVKKSGKPLIGHLRKWRFDEEPESTAKDCEARDTSH